MSSLSNRSSESNSSKLPKLKKRTKKLFTKMKTHIEELEDQSDISDSNESGSMFLQVVDTRSTVLKDKHNTFLNNKKETISGALTKPLWSFSSYSGTFCAAPLAHCFSYLILVGTSNLIRRCH